MQHWNMILRAGSEAPLSRDPGEEACRKLQQWQEGLRGALSPSQTPQLLWAAQLHLSQMFCRQEKHTHTGETCKSYLCPAVERWMCRFLWNICGFSQPCMDTCKLLPSWIGKCVFPLEFQTEWAIPATLSMRPGQKWTRSMLVRGYALTMGPGSPSKFFSPIQCFIHLLTQCKPDGKCCPSLSACYSLHGEGIQVYKPGRNLLAILALGWTCR